MLSSCTQVYPHRQINITMRHGKQSVVSDMHVRHRQRTLLGTWTVGSMSSIPPAPSKPPPEVPPERGEDLQPTAIGRNSSESVTPSLGRRLSLRRCYTLSRPC